MAPDANPDPADEQRYAEFATELVETAAAVVPGWIEQLVVERVVAWRGHVTDEIEIAAVAAGASARAEVVPALHTLVHTDIDEHRTNPLTLLRDASRHAHIVLEQAGVPPVERDEFALRSFPDDVYGLVPATWHDVDPSLHEVGIAWGAAKAFLFKARRREEGG